ncbi:MAG TPA: TIR domain-containing protein [Pseudonocardiaceae bacterium]|nr:TIR domain-containing protein [Pseudonocardiaceae bacterium]
MRWQGGLGDGASGRFSWRSDHPVDIFISYSPADERWATWVAWQLEAEGYRTLLQAWDFVPGSNFIDFMDRGVREAAVVVAMLSPNYLQSRYGRMEWQAALRTDVDKLVTVRIADCPLDGLLATITWVDLVDVGDAEQARRALLGRLRQALDGRAKPLREPDFPQDEQPPGRSAVDLTHQPPEDHPPATGSWEPPHSRRAPVTPPAYPPAVPAGPRQRDTITLLHVPGPRFGRGMADPDEPLHAKDLQARIWANVTRLADSGVSKPDLIVVTGDLTESAKPREIDEALTFLTGLRVLLGLEPDRLILVPGGHDVSKAACASYFSHCEAEDIPPQEPYFPKLKHYADLFNQLYQGFEGLVFDVAQPWTLFALPELRVAVAGLNSTMAASHRAEDNYGWIGERQAAWFADRLRPFEESGWLRIGLLRHDPAPGAGVAGADPALLRDAGTLGRLLGRRLNFVLHGPGPGGARLDFVDPDLPVLPAARPGQDEVVQVTADGLTRFSGHDDQPTENPETLRRRWHAVSGAFSAAKSKDAAEAESAIEPAAQPEQDRPQPAADPHSLLLDRVAEVCRTRYPKASVRRVDVEPAHLLITDQEDGFSPQRRIAAHVGEPTREVLDDFLRVDPDPGSELVYQGPPAAHALREEAHRRGVRLRSFIEFQGLLDLRGYLGRQTRRLRTDPRYPPELYVPQRFRTLDRDDHDVRDDLATELVDLVTADRPRFVLLLGDFGRGKTFALREVARRIAETMPHLVPILIELRTLDKAHTVDGLVAAHLANEGEELIDLKAFHYMLREGRIVLLFDGFDELVSRISYDRAADHLETLLRAAQDRAKIVVTSRTQHFKSTAQVFTVLGERVGLLPYRRILNVEDFTPAQVRAFLVNRYGGDERKADDRMGLIKGIADVLGLSRNPRMLSFIADLDDDRLRAAAHARQTVSAAALYGEILHSWMSYEAERARRGPGTSIGLRLEDQWRAVTALARRLWETGESYLRLSELTEVAGTLTELADSRLSPDYAAHAVGAGSLLVRTDEDLFGFIHTSVAEWLVAGMIAGQFYAGVAAPPELAQRALSQLTIDFLCDLADPRACQSWAEAVLGPVDTAGTGNADSVSQAVSRANAFKVSTRLRTPPTGDLRDAALPDEDLSHREMSGVDLTGADLSRARLVGTNLSGAILRDARLVDTRLDEARLAGADLRGADLTRARLPRTDLTDAQVAGSRWNRAVLVGATGVPNAPELRDAAIVPPQPVRTQFAPAAVGVRHGFRARLPQVLSYSRDGGTLAIGTEDGGVLIYDAVSGQPLRTLSGHRGRVFAVAYGERALITGGREGHVRLWDPNNGDPLAVLPEHLGWPWPLVVNAAGDLLVTGDSFGVIRLWDLPTGRLRRTCPMAGRGFIYSAAVSDRLVAASYENGTACVWDIATGEQTGDLAGADGELYRVAFSPDGRLLATGGAGGALRLWDAGTGHQVADLPGHPERLYTVAFHPTRPLLASADMDGGVRIWRTDTSDVTSAHTSEPVHVLTGHQAGVYWAAFSPSGDTLATGDSAGTVCLWDTETGRRRHRLTAHTGSIWPFAFRPDGEQLAISDDQFTTRLWDPATGQCRHTITGHGRKVTSVNFSGTGGMLAASGNDGTVRLWDPDRGRLLRRLAGTDDRLVMLETAVFSPTAARLVTVSNDGRMNLLDVASGGYERHINVESAPIWAVTFDSTGDMLATANDDDTVRTWYRSNGRLVRTLAEHRGRVRSIAYNADSSMLATGCDDTLIRLWDAESGRLLRTLSGHSDRVYAVAFSGDLLASASWDNRAIIWDTLSGEPMHQLGQHNGRLWTAAFNATGDLLATAGDDLVIRLWDPKTGRQLHALEGHTRSVWSVAFSPSGDLLASGGDDGTVRLWSISAEAPTSRPTLRMTLLGLPEGWAAIGPDGRYKSEGDIAGQYWHVTGMCRFEPGELDPHLSHIRRLSLDGPW